MNSTTRILTVICTATLLAGLWGCGGSSGDSAPSAQNAGIVPTPSNAYALVEDGYGLQNATFLSATRSDVSTVLRGAIADSMTDPDFATVFRIDIAEPASITGPGTYSVGGDSASFPKFPGEILIFNGHKSTLLATTSGTITFTSYGARSGEVIVGDFAIRVEDRNIALNPPPVHSIKVSFSFVVDTFGAIVPAPSPVPPAAAASYDAKCASCHSLGAHDAASAGGAPDLSLRGWGLAGKFVPDQPGHNNLALSASEMHDLRIFLNAN